MVAIPSHSELLDRARRQIRNLRPDIDTSPDSIVNRLHLLPAAIVTRMVFGQLDRVQGLQLLDNLSGPDLDAEATNYGQTRQSGRRARGFVVYFTFTQPTSDISIPIGSIVSTDPVALGRSVQFRTMATRSLPGGASAAAFFRRDTNRWETDPIPVEAIDPGIEGVVGEERIKIMQTQITGIDGVTNPTATRNGWGTETDAELRRRIERKRLGAERNLRRGLESYVVDTFELPDAHAVRPDDADAERPDGVDVWVIDDSTSEETVTLTHSKVIDLYALPKRPVLFVAGVAGASAGVLTEGTHWAFERDVSTPVRFSPRSLDRVRILSAGHTLLSEGETVTVVFSIAAQVAAAQEALDAEDAALLTADVVVKRAIQWTLTVSAVVTFFAGANSTQERERVRLALSQYGSALELGAPIQGSDVIVAIETGVAGVPVQSVDQVVLVDVVATSELGEVRRLSDDPQGEQVLMGPHEYARFGSISFISAP